MMHLQKLTTHFGLRQKLILAVALFVLAVGAILSAFSLWLFSERLSEKNLMYVNDITYQATNNVKKYAQEMEDISFAILSSNAIQDNLRLLNSGNLSESERIIAVKHIEDILIIYTLYNNDIVSLSVFTDSGKEIVSQSRFTPTKSLYSQEELYQANGSALWGLINDNDKDLCVARAILDLKTQKPIGFINLVFRQSYIGNIINDISISYENGSYLLNDDGQVVSSNVPERIGQQLELLRDANNNWSVSESLVGGIPCYVYKGSRMQNGWTMVTVISKNELTKETATLLLVNIIIDAIVILIAVITIWRIIRRITSPIDRLCRNMKEVGQGNFEKRELIDTNDEIGMLSRSYNEMVSNLESLIEHVYIMEISNRQAELEFLKMQINPHFLYNTLDTISWMARIEQKENIADVTIALASLLRNSIKQENRIPISIELENIRNYLLIQKYRFGEKLEWKLLIEPQCEEFYMPGFILQPLVENAIIHGLEPKKEKGKLMLSIKQEDGVVKFTVADNGVGMSEELMQQLSEDMCDKSTRSCIGLKNADRRLRLHYGDDSTLHVESDCEIGTRISFYIPVSQCI